MYHNIQENEKEKLQLLTNIRKWRKTEMQAYAVMHAEFVRDLQTDETLKILSFCLEYHYKTQTFMQPLKKHQIRLSKMLSNIIICSVNLPQGGSVAEWLACWTQVQKGLGSNRSRDAVG